MKNKITISNLTKTFNQELVFDKLTLSFDLSLFNCIKGSSGSGKSTLLNLISTLDSNYTGDIFFNDTHYKSLDEREINSFRSNKIGFVFQEHHMINDISILENILLPSFINRDKNAIDRAKELIKELNIENIINKKPLNCSGGEKQRASIARALINSPKVIIADEPTGNLDNENSVKVAKIFRTLNKKYGIGIILATHDDKVAEISDVNYYIINKSEVKSVNNNSMAFYQTIF